MKAINTKEKKERDTVLRLKKTDSSCYREMDMTEYFMAKPLQQCHRPVHKLKNNYQKCQKVKLRKHAA